MLRHRQRARPRPGRRRAGAALVELAIVLPLLSFILIASTDFARLFHDFILITDGARNGALYASQNTTQAAASYQAGVAAAALGDAGSLKPTPTVAVAAGTLGAGYGYVDVSVTYPFRTITSYPGIPSTMTLTRTVRMRVPPSSYRLL